tara:strand:- start:378 stop:1277 length:900 start_codon:yes stop_codon:yes gene_type:complete
LNWLELSIKSPPEFVEPLSHIFYKYGEGGVSVEYPAEFNPDEGEVAPVPDFLTIKTYLRFDETLDHRRANIEIGVKLVAHVCEIEPLVERKVEEEDWESNWKEYFHPITIGKKLVICPTWRTSDCYPQRSVVMLDPGMAFGTGHHPTTRMCLELLEEIIQGEEKVLDIGCGSGILSIAAVQLGAEFSRGIEIHENAVDVARENCVSNNVDDKIDIVLGTLDEHKFNECYDVAVANISSKVIVDLIQSLVGSIKVGGALILSGILSESFANIERAVSGVDVRIEDVKRDGDWVAILAFKH